MQNHTKERAVKDKKQTTLITIFLSMSKRNIPDSGLLKC